MKYNALAILLLASAVIPLMAQPTDEQFQSADQSLMVLPTAYTMPRGRSTFTDYELGLLQYAYGVTGTTHLSLGMPFPVVTEAFNYFTLGVKQNFLKSGNVQSAAIASYNIHFHTGMLGNALSIGNPRASLHADAFWTNRFGKTNERPNDFFLGAGGIVNVSNRVAIISELFTFSDLYDEKSNAIWTIGARIKGDRMSWDIGGFRGLKNNGDSLILIPLLKATVLF
jgi:hypothetical protein